MAIGHRGGFLAAGLAAALAAGTADAQQPPQAPPPAVTVVTVAERDVTPTLTFTGRIVAVDRVDLRARVDGFLEERLFTEGDDVRKDQVLFRIERERYAADVQAAEGAVLAAEGTLRLAEIEVDRQSTLVQRQAAAQARLDQAEAERKRSEGAVLEARAHLDKAKLNLSYTEISSPIDGRIGVSAFSVGNFLSPQSGSLATVVSQDPIYVEFPVTVRQLLAVRASAEAATRDPRDVLVKVVLANGAPYPEAGRINFVDIAVDPGTDSVTIRASLSNPDRLLIDGALVTAVVETGKPEKRLVVPQTAVQFDQSGRFVLTLDRENKVQVRPISIGPAVGLLYAVERGLAAGDRVITEGLQKVRPGVVVSPTETDLPPVAPTRL
jgi:membrane fusion protein (multidrug efflux system)